MSSTKKGRRRRRKGTARTTASKTFAEEYAYVLKDLRRVFLLAGAMFILLIALNLLLQ